MSTFTFPSSSPISDISFSSDGRIFTVVSVATTGQRFDCSSLRFSKKWTRPDLLKIMQQEQNRKRKRKSQLEIQTGAFQLHPNHYVPDVIKIAPDARLVAHTGAASNCTGSSLQNQDVSVLDSTTIDENRSSSSSSTSTTTHLANHPGCEVVAHLQGHETSVRCIAWRPDGHVIASGSDAHENEIKLWDIADSSRRMKGEYGEVIYIEESLKGHQYPIYCLAFSRCSNFLVSVDGGSYIIVWNVDDDSLRSNNNCSSSSSSSSPNRRISHYIKSNLIRSQYHHQSSGYGSQNSGHCVSVCFIGGYDQFKSYESCPPKWIALLTSKFGVLLFDFKNGSTINYHLQLSDFLSESFFMACSMSSQQQLLQTFGAATTVSSHRGRRMKQPTTNYSTPNNSYIIPGHMPDIFFLVNPGMQQILVLDANRIALYCEHEKIKKKAAQEESQQQLKKYQKFDPINPLALGEEGFNIRNANNFFEVEENNEENNNNNSVAAAASASSTQNENENNKGELLLHRREIERSGVISAVTLSPTNPDILLVALKQSENNNNSIIALYNNPELSIMKKKWEIRKIFFLIHSFSRNETKRACFSIFGLRVKCCLFLDY